MYSKALYCLFPLFFHQYCYSQNVQVTGSVSANDGQKIISATIQLKEKKNLNLLTYSFTNDIGSYKLSANITGKPDLYLIVSSLGFKRDTILISTFESPVSVHNFILEPDETQLKDINIKSTKSAIVEVNDTTKYSVKNFSSEDDRNLEGVIKKMPGMEISTDGTIYFKKKKISKVLLENDDLTGDNYKSITQNLKPDLVDEVQAIENWVEDDLLRGIINSDDIVLNLTLKDKRKQKMIGDVDIGYGTNNRREINSNLITYLNKTKAFGFLSNNNTGSSYENTFKLAGSDGKLQGDNKLINHQIFSNTPFEGAKLGLNNSISGSLNSVTRINDFFKVSGSFYASENKLFAENRSTNIYYEPLNATIINGQDQKSNNKLFQTDLNADYLVKKNARLTLKMVYKFRPQQFNADAYTNFNNFQNEKVSQLQADKLNDYAADLTYTVKANGNSAIIFSTKFAKNDIIQNYNSSSNLYANIPLFDGITNLVQSIDVDYSTFKINIQALKKLKSNYLYLDLGAESTQTTLNSGLSNSDNTRTFANFANQNEFSITNAYLTGKYNYGGKKTRFFTMLKVSLVNQKSINDSKNLFIVEPQVGLNTKFSELQNLSLIYNYRNTLANPLDYYADLILTDIRTINSGISNIYNYGTHAVNLTYSNNILSDKYLSLNSTFGFRYNNGGFLNTNSFKNTIFYNEKSPSGGNRSLNFSIGLQKFLPSISNNLSLNYTPVVSDYFAQVNDVVNKYQSVSQILVIKSNTGFKLPINFALEFQYQNNTTKLGDEKINDQSSFKFGIQPKLNLSKTIYGLIDFNLYKIGNQNYKLLNSQLLYTPKKGNFKYALYAKNLFDLKSIDYIDVSNVGESYSNSTILGRYFLASVSLAIR
ncbi:hypothetical protein [Pedobacter borealis]|uniref:hypothetical protein n=1 Tax=Pedobacter borealis TaxID=475254 RepID=UPI000492FDE9|nr:hypothetical protein [Pedobacter borealis]